MKKRILTIIMVLILLVANCTTTFAAKTHTYNTTYYEEWQIRVHVEISNLEDDYSQLLANQMVKVKTITDSDTSNYRNIRVELELADGVKITSAKGYIGIGYTSLSINDNVLTKYFSSAPSSRVDQVLIYAEHTCTTSTEERIESTCYQEGSIVKKCISCGHTMSTATIEKKSHNWSEWSVETSATCQSGGKEVRTCLNNGCVEKEEKTITKLDTHNWNEWSVETPATCHSDGQEVRSCLTTGCEEKETKPISKTGIHNWSEWKVIDTDENEEIKKEIRNCLDCKKEEIRETVISKDVTITDENTSTNSKAPATSDSTDVGIWCLITMFFVMIIVLNEKNKHKY